MSKYKYSTVKPGTAAIQYKTALFITFLFLIHLLSGYKYSYASDFSSNNYQLTFEKNLISISATKANLKSILIDIAEKANITIRYPSSLDEKITLKISDMPLKKALDRLLKDFNYSIIYFGSKKRAVISDVYVLEKDKKSAPVSRAQSRIANRISTYERRIATLKKNLSKIDQNSARGKRYSRQIQSYERTIERLKRR